MIFPKPHPNTSKDNMVFLEIWLLLQENYASAYLQVPVLPYIETSQLIYTANQLAKLALNGLNKFYFQLHVHELSFLKEDTEDL